LKTGALVKTINTFDGSTIANAFAGSMLNSTLDVDLNYKDDAVYIGYVKKAGDGTWTQGGVARLLTKEDTDPTNWEASIVYDNIGPVTSSVEKLVHKNKGILWLFFGTGRYYYEQLATVDDENGQRTLFGLKEPCYSSAGLDPNCTTTFSGTLTDVSNDPPPPAPQRDPETITNGWYINLDPSGNYAYYEGASLITRYYRAERVITDPVAMTTGLVFFTSYKPYSDVCAYGGKSFIWAVKYDTGGAPAGLLKGVAILQVSTGSIEQVNLSTAFRERGERRTSAMEGVPPTSQGLSLLSTPPPVKKVIHVRER
jgi:type IV pilus assembly protein PilY1